MYVALYIYICHVFCMVLLGSGLWGILSLILVAKGKLFLFNSKASF